MRYYNKVALFIDFENFHSTLQKSSESKTVPYGFSPKFDFEKLIDTLKGLYGPIYPEDCIVVANFSHYDQQKGGLSRVATIINVDSFESRVTRAKIQGSPGKKFVIQNYADMRLAYEIGKHSTKSPAELYIICSGDKAFAAVGQALQQSGHEVLFLLPAIEKAGRIIKERFNWVAFQTVSGGFGQTTTQLEPTKEKNLRKKKNTPTDVLCNVISKLRHEFRSPVPVALIKAMVGPGQAEQLINSARSEGRIDIWMSPQGAECISSQDERLYGKVVPQTTREDLIRKTKVLLGVAIVAEQSAENISRSIWRNNLKEQLNIGNKEAKVLLSKLFLNEILIDGELNKPDMSLEKVIRFLHDL